jgi:hypothetical protein
MHRLVSVQMACLKFVLPKCITCNVGSRMQILFVLTFRSQVIFAVEIIEQRKKDE